MKQKKTTKPTMATVKSFVKKNRDKLLICVDSTFDGMTDCVMPTGDDSFTPALFDGYTIEDAWYRRTLGIQGAWFVGDSRDYIYTFDIEGFTGFEISNSCGCFKLAVKV